MARESVLERLVTEFVFTGNFDDVDEYNKKIEEVADTVRAAGAATVAAAAVAANAWRDMTREVVTSQADIARAVRRAAPDATPQDAQDIQIAVAEATPGLGMDRAGNIVAGIGQAAGSLGMQLGVDDYRQMAMAAAAVADRTGESEQEVSQTLIEALNVSNMTTRGFSQFALNMTGGMRTLESALSNYAEVQSQTDFGQYMQFVSQAQAAGVSSDPEWIASTIRGYFEATSNPETLAELSTGGVNIQRAIQGRDMNAWLQALYDLSPEDLGKILDDSDLPLFQELASRQFQITPTAGVSVSQYLANRMAEDRAMFPGAMADEERLEALEIGKMRDAGEGSRLSRIFGWVRQRETDLYGVPGTAAGAELAGDVGGLFDSAADLWGLIQLAQLARRRGAGGAPTIGRTLSLAGTRGGTSGLGPVGPLVGLGMDQYAALEAASQGDIEGVLNNQANFIRTMPFVPALFQAMAPQLLQAAGKAITINGGINVDVATDASPEDIAAAVDSRLRESLTDLDTTTASGTER